MTDLVTYMISNIYKSTLELIDDEVRPQEKIPNMLDEHQTIENEEAGEAEDYEDYDYSCYK